MLISPGQPKAIERGSQRPPKPSPENYHSVDKVTLGQCALAAGLGAVAGAGIAAGGSAFNPALVGSGGMYLGACMLPEDSGLIRLAPTMAAGFGLAFLGSSYGAAGILASGAIGAALGVGLALLGPPGPYSSPVG